MIEQIYKPRRGINFRCISSRYIKYKDEKLADKPIDADANGAYCIALKGLYEILQIKNNWKEGEVFSRDTLKITNADWLRFMQSRGFE